MHYRYPNEDLSNAETLITKDNLVKNFSNFENKRQMDELISNFLDLESIFENNFINAILS